MTTRNTVYIAGGKLDRRITFQKQGMAEDGEYGPLPGAWADVAEMARLPAQVWDILPSVAETTGKVIDMAARPARVRMRYLRGITSDMRVIVHNEDDVVYQISSGPAEIGRREYIEFMIVEHSS